MGAWKKLNQQDVYLTTYTAKKSWTIESSSFNSQGIFNKKSVINYYNNFLKYDQHFNSYLLFQILISELWVSQILKN